MTRSMTNILVTGTTRGIGTAVAHDAARRGGRRSIGHGSRDGARHDRRRPCRTGGRRPAVAAALDRAGGRIDVLVNNAGVFEALSSTGDDAEWSGDVGAVAGDQPPGRRRPVAPRRAAFRRERGGGGRIVNVACRAAFRGDLPDHWHYAAAKAGMVAMTRTIARAYAAENILAFVVAPGFTMTGMAEDYLASRGGEKLLADIPLGRVASVAEVAETIRWLALDAPPSLTGAVLDLNGASYVR